MLSVDYPGARFSMKFKLRQWDGKRHFFNVKNNTTFTHLLEKILPFLISVGFDIDITDNRPERLPSPSFKATEDMFAEYGLTLRDYQVECVNTLIDEGSGILLSSTGSGKTLVCAGVSKCYETLGYRSMVIVPSVDLINQTYNKYKECGLDVGRYDGQMKDINHMHLISTWQSLQNNLGILSSSHNIVNEAGDIQSSGRFEVLIIDEMHLATASILQEILNEAGGHIQFRFGVTGTIPKDKMAEMTLFSSIGPIRKEITAKYLMDRGFLSTVEIHPIQLKMDEDLPDYAAEKAYLNKDQRCLPFLQNFISEKAQEHGNTLVIVNSITFGKRLAKLFDEDDVVFIFGESETELRKEQYDRLNSGHGKIAIASAGIASTGIDIPNVTCGIFIFPGKSFVRAIQSIGRFLRRTGTKKHAIVYDIGATLKYSKSHQKERLKFCKEASYPVHSLEKIDL
jgi:superfamily II DNA or RNA helicase